MARADWWVLCDDVVVGHREYGPHTEQRARDSAAMADGTCCGEHRVERRPVEKKEKQG